MSHKIDTLKELREEKERLKREMNIARQYLDTKMEYTYTKSKQLFIKQTSWPLAIRSLANLGVQQLAPKSNVAAKADNSSTFSILDGIQQGVDAMQQPGNDKWYAMLPIALKFLENWLATNADTSKTQTEHSKQNSYPPKPKHTDLAPSTVPVVS